jgi:crotonobetainyl-CoA:carnitine CoA-transferase CaiB-like acyl-CoA transferase
MTEALAGPYCSMLLGDLGADVIKVERPGVGDQSRAWGPPFLEGESAYYLSVNRNKRSIELDIKKSEDLSVLHSLLATADVFLTNLPRMASLERAGIDPEVALQRNPRLVFAAISGYGHSGPKAGRSGYDLIAQGEAGSMALTGEPGDGPMRFPTPMADITAGIYATTGILSALYERDKAAGGSGEGQFIDISLVDSQVTWLANVGGTYFANGERPPKMGNLHPSIAPYQPMRARDRVIIVAVGTERLWERFCKVLGVDETLMRNPRFATNRERNRHRDELIPQLEVILAERDADAWVEDLVQAGVPAGPVNYPDQILQDEHLVSRGMIVELEHPLIGLVRSIGNPVRMSSTGVSYRRHPPRLGEHNAEIRAEAGEWSGVEGRPRL